MATRQFLSKNSQTFFGAYLGMSTAPGSSGDKNSKKMKIPDTLLNSALCGKSRLTWNKTHAPVPLHAHARTQAPAHAHAHVYTFYAGVWPKLTVWLKWTHAPTSVHMIWWKSIKLIWDTKEFTNSKLGRHHMRLKRQKHIQTDGKTLTFQQLNQS